MIKRLFLVVSSLFLATSLCFAQEVEKNKIIVLDSFEKGLATKLSLFSFSPSQADICENVRLSDSLKALTKRQQILLYGTADTTEAITGMHRLYLNNGTKILLVNHGDEIESGVDSTGAFTPILTLATGDYRWQWTTWNGVAIGTDGYNQPVKYDGSSVSATYLGTALAKIGVAGSPSGTYTYKVSFYTTTYEVLFGIASNSVSPSSQKVNLSMIPIGPDTFGGETVVGRKVYRVEGGTWKLLSNGTIADNSTTTLLDNDTTASGASYPAVSATVIAATPPKGKLCLIHDNRLFLANDPNAPSRLYYSDDSSIDYFIPTDYYRDIRPDDGDQITFLKTFLGVLRVGKENTIQNVFTDGSTPSSDWDTSNVISTIGCKAMYSAQDTPLGIFYLGSDGLYKFNGQYSTLLSDAITPEIKDILESNRANVWAQYHKSTYYLAYPSKKTGVSANNRILLYDLITNAFSIDLLNANCFTTFNSGTDWDTLYYGSSTNGKIYNYTFQAYELSHGRHADFSGTFTSTRYIPVGVGGDADDPELEIARTEHIDDLVEHIDDLTGTIDRDSLTGNYVSQSLNLGASAYDKLYWNERFVSSGDNVTLAIRSGEEEHDLDVATWSSEYSDPSGSNVSALTANAWTQYRISMTTDSFSHSPEVYKANNYNVKLTYFKEAGAVESTIALHWRTGWLNFMPGYKVTLRKIQVYHEGTSGTLNIQFKNFEGDTDTFAINLATNPNFYEERFTGGALTGELFRIDINNSDLNSLRIDKIILVADIEPII